MTHLHGKPRDHQPGCPRDTITTSTFLDEALGVSFLVGLRGLPNAAGKL